MNILITGANGFLGSWLCRVGSSIDEVRVIATVRKNADTSKIESLPNTTIVTIDYSDEALITKYLQDIQSEFGNIDLIIHNAGLTKSTKNGAFKEINVGITTKFTSAIKATGILQNGIFTYISSQAALGPAGCDGPVSEYGESKLEAEVIVTHSGLNYLIFRPTGIYGPEDSEFLSLFKSVKLGLYPCAAPINQKITLIHVYDVGKNIIDLSFKLKNRVIHLSDGHVYSHRDMKSALEKALGKTSLLLKIPSFITTLFLSINQSLGRTFGYEPILTNEKHNEISKDWDHDFSLERKEIPLAIKFDLQSGFIDTSTYYKSKKLL